MNAYLLMSDVVKRIMTVPGRLETNLFFLGSSILLSTLSNTGINAYQIKHSFRMYNIALLLSNSSKLGFNTKTECDQVFFLQCRYMSCVQKCIKLFLLLEKSFNNEFISMDFKSYNESD